MIKYIGQYTGQQVSEENLYQDIIQEIQKLQQNNYSSALQQSFMRFLTFVRSYLDHKANKDTNTVHISKIEKENILNTVGSIDTIDKLIDKAESTNQKSKELIEEIKTINPVSIDRGGTGAKTAEDARDNLGITELLNDKADANHTHDISDLTDENHKIPARDTSGKIASTELPSYVDDVLEYNSTADFPQEGETGKIYIALNTNQTYRWSGSEYVMIRGDLALGETDLTAYRGDRGKLAYEHSQQPHAPANAEPNQNAFFKVNNIEAQNSTDNFTIEAGSNISINNDINNKKITISATGGIEPTDIISIDQGGTGATTASEARLNLGVTAELNDKVDKVIGKQLSTNDFTDEYKELLDDGEIGLKIEIENDTLKFTYKTKN